MQVSSVEAGDLYLRIFDRLSHVPIDDLTELLAQARRDAISITTEVVETGALADPGNANPAHLLAVLLGLHRALLYADPARDIPDKKGMATHAMRWDMYRRLNNDPAEGVVIFSRAIAGHPDVRNAPNRLRDLVPGVLRVSAADLNEVELIAATWVNDLRLPGPVPPDVAELHGAAEVTVGQIPLLASPADVTWTLIVKPDGLPENAYTVAPVTGHLTSRIPAAVAAFDKAGVHLGLVPESSLDDKLLETWRTELADPGRAAGPMQWLLVGTGPVTSVGQPVPATTGKLPNRAVLLTAAGDLVFTQDKRSGFTLSDEQISRYRLQATLGNSGPLAEYIRKGRKFTVFDATAGRFAIAICEDHGRMIATGEMCANFGVTHLLVPVIAPAMWPGGWQCVAARQFASENGVSTAVANSLAIDQRGWAAGPNPAPPAVTLFAVQAPHRAPVKDYTSVHEDPQAGRDPVVDPRIDCLDVRKSCI